MSNDDRVFVSESSANRAAQRLEEEIYSDGQWVDVDEVGEDKFEVKVHDIVHQRVFNEGDNPATDWEGGKDFPIYVSRYWRHNQEDEFWDAWHAAV